MQWQIRKRKSQKQRYKMHKLNNGREIADIAFGTWHLLGKECIIAVKNAIKCGYRIIDTAQAYNNEEEIGIAVNECISEGIVKREELFISSKINPHNPIGYNEAIAAVNTTLQMMHLDYIDMYMIHWPNLVADDSWKKLNAETYRGFEYMVNTGKLRCIGISNFMIHHLEELLKTTQIKPVINQLNLNPTWQQKEVVNFCKQNNIACQAWAPLIRLKDWNKTSLETVAAKYNKSVAQICLRWSIQKGFIPITKTGKIERMKENLSIFDFEIANEDMQILDNLNSHPWDHNSQPDCLYVIFKLREQLSKKEIISNEKFKLLSFIPLLNKIENKDKNETYFKLFNVFTLITFKNANKTKTYVYLFKWIKIGKITRNVEKIMEKFLPYK